MLSYDTVSEAIDGLKKRGYTLDFNLKSDCIECGGQQLNPKDFEITEFHRFEGSSDPADESIVYAIESSNGMKGVLVNAFGVYSEALDDEMVRKLNFSEKLS